MNPNNHDHRALLQDIARRAMLERGLLPDFSPAALAELAKLQAAAKTTGRPVNDLRDKLIFPVKPGGGSFSRTRL